MDFASKLWWMLVVLGRYRPGPVTLPFLPCLLLDDSTALPDHSQGQDDVHDNPWTFTILR